VPDTPHCKSIFLNMTYGIFQSGLKIFDSYASLYLNELLTHYTLNVTLEYILEIRDHKNSVFMLINNKQRNKSP